MKELGFATVANLWGKSWASREEKGEVFWGWVGLRGLRGPRGLRGASPVRCVCEAAPNKALHWSFAVGKRLCRESWASREEKAEVFWGWVGLRGLRGPRGLRGASPVRCTCEAAESGVLHWCFAVEKRSERQMFNCASARRSTCEAIKLYAPHKSFAPVRRPLVPLDPWVPLVLTISSPSAVRSSLRVRAGGGRIRTGTRGRSCGCRVGPLRRARSPPRLGPPRTCGTCAAQG